jgi:hypothetical protein
MASASFQSPVKLDDEQLAAATKLFDRQFSVSANARTHPHPLAHLERVMVYNEIFRLSRSSLAVPNPIIVDVGCKRGHFVGDVPYHGLAPVLDSRDFLRVHDQGRPTRPTHTFCAHRFEDCRCPQTLAASVAWLVQSAYYVNPASIARWLRNSNNRVAYVAAHEFPEVDGTMYVCSKHQPEARYSRHTDGTVTFEVAGNHYAYHHNVVDWLFNLSGLDTPYGRIAWAALTEIGHAHIFRILLIPDEVPLAPTRFGVVPHLSHRHYGAVTFEWSRIGGSELVRNSKLYSAGRAYLALVGSAGHTGNADERVVVMKDMVEESGRLALTKVRNPEILAGIIGTLRQKYPARTPNSYLIAAMIGMTIGVEDEMAAAATLLANADRFNRHKQLWDGHVLEQTSWVVVICAYLAACSILFVGYQTRSYVPLPFTIAISGLIALVTYLAVKRIPSLYLALANWLNLGSQVASTLGVIRPPSVGNTQPMLYEPLVNMPALPSFDEGAIRTPLAERLLPNPLAGDQAALAVAMMDGPPAEISRVAPVVIPALQLIPNGTQHDVGHGVVSHTPDVTKLTKARATSIGPVPAGSKLFSHAPNSAMSFLALCTRFAVDSMPNFEPDRILEASDAFTHSHLFELMREVAKVLPRKTVPEYIDRWPGARKKMLERAGVRMLFSRMEPSMALRFFAKYEKLLGADWFKDPRNIGANSDEFVIQYGPAGLQMQDTLATALDHRLRLPESGLPPKIVTFCGGTADSIGDWYSTVRRHIEELQTDTETIIAIECDGSRYDNTHNEATMRAAFREHRLLYPDAPEQLYVLEPLKGSSLDRSVQVKDAKIQLNSGRVGTYDINTRRNIRDVNYIMKNISDTYFAGAGGDDGLTLALVPTSLVPGIAAKVEAMYEKLGVKAKIIVGDPDFATLFSSRFVPCFRNDISTYTLIPKFGRFLQKVFVTLEPNNRLHDKLRSDTIANWRNAQTLNPLYDILVRRVEALKPSKDNTGGDLDHYNYYPEKTSIPDTRTRFWWEKVYGLSEATIGRFRTDAQAFTLHAIYPLPPMFKERCEGDVE